MNQTPSTTVAYIAATAVAFAGLAFGAVQVRQTVDPQPSITLIEKDCRPYENSQGPGSQYKGIVHPCTVIL